MNTTRDILIIMKFSSALYSRDRLVTDVTDKLQVSRHKAGKVADKPQGSFRKSWCRFRGIWP